ncbi:MAG: hemolysin, partial [Thermoleophilaceae bacterium]|nr:hemolysin [Thermoleophilaceae bacterium]
MNPDSSAPDLARSASAPQASEPVAALPLVKPRMRGVLHQYAFFVAAVLGVVLVIVAPDARARVAVAIYAFAVSGLLGTSALYHRLNWTDTARAWMRRLD